MFHLSKREIDEKFTKSELYLLSWRSMETAHQMERKVPVDKPMEKMRSYGNVQVPADLPKQFYDENGEVNLSKVTGREAYKYLSALGFKMPVMMPKKKG